MSAVRDSVRGDAKPSAVVSAVAIEKLSKPKGCRVWVVCIDTASRLTSDNPTFRSVSPGARAKLVGTMPLLWLVLDLWLVRFGLLYLGKMKGLLFSKL